MNDGSECEPFFVCVSHADVSVGAAESLCVQVCLILRSDHIIIQWLWSSTDFLVEKDNDYCVCQTPCNMTRYGKELSMVKIPSKASAKYLAKKFNKTEQYIG